MSAPLTINGMNGEMSLLPTCTFVHGLPACLPRCPACPHLQSPAWGCVRKRGFAE